MGPVALTMPMLACRYIVLESKAKSAQRRRQQLR